MLILGLTGSIATGKSTVSNILRSAPYNLPIIDADVLARQVVEPGTSGYNQILAYFGPTTPDLLLPGSESGGPNGPDGKGRPLNRPALGRRVFGNEPDKVRDRKKLGQIIHPAVQREMWKALLYYYLTGRWCVVVDVPLLFEGGMDAICGSVMVVAVKDPAVQMQRLMDRDSFLTEEDAKNRVMSQGDVREKAKRCEARGKGRGVVVWNDGGIEDLKSEIARAMTEVQSGSPKWWAWLLLLCPPMGVGAGLYTYLRTWIIRREYLKAQAKETAKL
ncbi:CoaE-domain-containing protein [Eremomyces bilateralis CBS 781.70]|uniref:CoaE-domain-containing protein n=1 Tax=Eremomyces bilateralis CBS 781.70 TaxID=1392243 RepID=A0A6G1G7F5_9PEZI|nr:CoaE-domain-containing protein [Eremomyces bilateralis CBS 781.70]KAF1813866.1 CoaE-domain-containing protein [Eremomyces bilateralis CBS 781.70]